MHARPVHTHIHTPTHATLFSPLLSFTMRVRIGPQQSSHRALKCCNCVRLRGTPGECALAARRGAGARLHDEIHFHFTYATSRGNEPRRAPGNSPMANQPLPTYQLLHNPRLKLSRVSRGRAYLVRALALACFPARLPRLSAGPQLFRKREIGSAAPILRVARSRPRTRLS